MSITRNHIDKEWIEKAAQHISEEKPGQFKFIPFPAHRLLASPPPLDDWRKRYLYLDNSFGDRRGWIVFEEDIDETRQWNIWGTIMLAVGGFFSLPTYQFGMWAFVPAVIVLAFIFPAFLYWLLFIKPWQSKIFENNQFVLLDEDVWGLFNSVHSLRQQAASLPTAASSVTGAIAGGIVGALGGSILGKLADRTTSMTIDVATDAYVTDVTKRTVIESGEKFLVAPPDAEELKSTK